jgi:hypothetical protein
MWCRTFYTTRLIVWPQTSIADHAIIGLLGHSRRGVPNRYLHPGDKALLGARNLVASQTLD